MPTPATAFLSPVSIVSGAPYQPPLDRETVSAAQTLIEADLTPRTGRETTGHWQGYGLQNHQDGTLRARSWVMGPNVILDTNLAMTPNSFRCRRTERSSFTWPLSSSRTENRVKPC